MFFFYCLESGYYHGTELINGHAGPIKKLCHEHVVNSKRADDNNIRREERDVLAPRAKVDFAYCLKLWQRLAFLSLVVGQFDTLKIKFALYRLKRIMNLRDMQCSNTLFHKGP